MILIAETGSMFTSVFRKVVSVLHRLGRGSRAVSPLPLLPYSSTCRRCETRNMMATTVQIRPAVASVTADRLLCPEHSWQEFSTPGAKPSAHTAQSADTGQRTRGERHSPGKPCGVGHLKHRRVQMIKKVSDICTRTPLVTVNLVVATTLNALSAVSGDCNERIITDMLGSDYQHNVERNLSPPSIRYGHLLILVCIYNGYTHRLLHCTHML